MSRNTLDYVSSRRNLLTALPTVAAGVGLGSCASLTGNGNTTNIAANVIDAIQAALATGCGFVPDVKTLLALAADFPSIYGVATISSQLLTTVSDFLCQSFHTAGGIMAANAAASGGPKMRGKLKSGATIEVHGLVVGGSGKFVKF